MQATVVHVAVVFFFFFLLFCQSFVTFWGLWQKTELPTWTWSQGHVNTDICFKPRVDTLLSLPLIFAFHAHVTLFILQPIWPCLHEGHVQFTTKRRNVFGLNLQEGIFAAVLYSFHPSFDLPFAISSRQKKNPLWFSPWETCKTKWVYKYVSLRKTTSCSANREVAPKVEGVCQNRGEFPVRLLRSRLEKKRGKFTNSNKIEIGNVSRQH